MKSLCVRILGRLLVICSTAASGIAGESETASLDAITVTAQKQEDNVQEVSISISVFNNQAVGDRKIESLNDIVAFVPNLVVTDGSGRAY